jgi:hypothetical protein
MRTPVAISRGLYLGLLAAAVASGCARNKKAEPLPDIIPAAADLTQPPVVAADAGLEATWVGSSAERAAFAAAITPYLYEAVPASREAQEMWAANGLRVVRVPLSEWPQVSSALQISGAAQRQWLAVTGAWTEIVRGADRPRGQVVALDAERVELGPGRLRMLSRCWIAPVPGDRGTQAEFAVELVPQLYEQAGVASKIGSLTHAPRAQDPIEQGLLFDRMRLTLRVRGDAGGPYAYLVVSERPGVDWREAVGDRPESDEPIEEENGPRPAPAVGEVVRGGAGRSDAAEVASGSGGSSGGAVAGPTGAGPQAPHLPTLGESLFSAPQPATTATGENEERAEKRSTRAVLVLIPRVPSGYRMLPSAPAPAVGAGAADRPRAAKP